MKTLLVTGAHGFIGRQVCKYYAGLGYLVTGMGHGAWSKQEKKEFGLTFWHSTDITLDAMVTYAGEPDLIVHCAGSGSVAFSMTHPYQDFTRTVLATASVLEYIRLHSPSTALLYPSSAAVYGKARQLPINERDALNPVSPYGMHKHMVENLCQSYAANFGLSVAIIRFFSVYGNGLSKQLLWDASNKIRQDQTSFFGSGNELRDWIHVNDACALIEKTAAIASSACPVINGGGGQGVTVKEVLSLLFDCFEREDAPVFTGLSRSGDPDHYVADIAQAQSIGWQPKIDLKTGLSEYVQWFRQNQQ